MSKLESHSTDIIVTSFARTTECHDRRTLSLASSVAKQLIGRRAAGASGLSRIQQTRDTSYVFIILFECDKNIEAQNALIDDTGFSPFFCSHCFEPFVVFRAGRSMIGDEEAGRAHYLNMILQSQGTEWTHRRERNE